jgi:hypothetical protein
MALLTVGHGRGSRATNGHVKRPLWVAAVQGIEKTSIQCPSLPDLGSQSHTVLAIAIADRGLFDSPSLIYFSFGVYGNSRHRNVVDVNQRTGSDTP